MPTILHRIIEHPELRLRRTIKVHIYRQIYTVTYTQNQHTVYIIVDTFFIFKYILYFPTVSHPNSLQSMEKLPLLSRDFGRDSEKLLQNRIVIYLPCPVIFFFFTLLIQLISFFHSQNWSYQCCSVQAWGLHYLPFLNWNETFTPLGIFSLLRLCLCFFICFFSFVLFSVLGVFFIHCK